MKVAQKTIKFLLIAVITLFTAVSFASESDKKHNDQNDGGRVNTKSEVEAYILHHIKDSHDFSLFSYTNNFMVE
jgi:F-type H+-transporting ATPase subunit a